MLSKLLPLLKGARPALGASLTIVGAVVALWGVLLLLDRPIATVEVGGQFQRVAPVQIEEPSGGR